MSGFGSFIAVLIAIAVCYFGYRILKRYRSENDGSGSGAPRNGGRGGSSK